MKIYKWIFMLVAVMAITSCENKGMFWESEPHALIPYTGKPDEVARCINEENHYRTGTSSYVIVKDGLHQVNGGDVYSELWPWGVILRLDGVAEVRGTEALLTGEKFWEAVPSIVEFCANK